MKNLQKGHQDLQCHIVELELTVECRTVVCLGDSWRGPVQHIVLSMDVVNAGGRSKPVPSQVELVPR